MSNFLHLSASQLRAAAHIKDQIEAMMKELADIFTTGYPTPAPIIATKKRTMSAAGRARVAAAQKARWAKVKKPKAIAKTAKKGMNAAAKAKLSALAKARWAKLKAEGKTKM